MVRKNLKYIFQQIGLFSKMFLYFCLVEKLILHIERLLACNDHVIVPGLGGFAVQHQSATIHGQTILPPAATIGFNPLMRHNDGLLAIEVSRSLKITYRQAMALITEEVADFMQSLRNNDDAKPLGQLGHFSKSDATLIFVPAARPAFLPNNLGYSTIYTRQYSRNTEVNVNHRINHYSWMKYAAIVILMLGLLLPSSINEHHNFHTADFNILNNIELNEIVITASAPTAELDHEAEIKTETAIPAEIAAAPPTTTTIKSTTNNSVYQIVVAVLQSETNATRLATELKSDLYPNATVIALSGNYAVAITAFGDIIPAVNFMENLRRQDLRFKDAWVMKIQ